MMLGGFGASGGRRQSSSGFPKLDGYDVRTKLGEGANARVYSAVKKDTKLPVALKCIDVDRVADGIELLLLEMTNIGMCDSEHIIRQYDTLWPESMVNTLVVVMEAVVGGTLQELLEMRVAVTESLLIAVAHDVLQGLSHLHNVCHLVHRDVKGANILIGRDGVAKLSDFGTAAAVAGTEGARMTAIGTPGWIAPEVVAVLRNRDEAANYTAAPMSDLERLPAADDEEALAPPSTLDATANYRGEYRDGYRYEADIWSLGTTLIELVAGMPSADVIVALREAVAEGKGLSPGALRPGSPALSAPFLRFVGKMLEPSPSERATAAELLEDAVLEPVIRNPRERRLAIANAARQLPCSFDGADIQQPADPQRSTSVAGDGEDSTGSLAGDSSALDDSSDTGRPAKRRGSDASHGFYDEDGDSDGSSDSAVESASAAGADEPPSSCPSMRTTSWAFVNPAIASVLRGRDVSVGSVLNPEFPPPTYQRAAAFKGLRAASRRDERIARLTGTATMAPQPPTAAETLSQMCRPFGPLYTYGVARPMRRMWDSPMLPRGGVGNVPELATRQQYAQRIEKLVSDCEATIPGFSARFLVAALERATQQQVATARFASLVDSGLEQTAHADNNGLYVERARGPAVSFSQTARSLGPGSLPDPTPLNLVPPANVPAAEAPRLGITSDDVQSMPVVVSSAVGRNAGRSAVNVTSLLFDRWKGDVARSIDPSR